tara:strand:+ start:317 stop:1036 length:720 start_codon:yes stop_codon:yes gene_type:complete
MYKIIRQQLLTFLFRLRENTLGVIRNYNLIRKSPFERFQEESLENSYQTFKKYFPSSIFFKKNNGLIFGIKEAQKNYDDEDLFMELGVFKGKSINLLSSFLKNKNIYGFDSFEGLKEDWPGTMAQASTFDLKGNIPKVNKNVRIIKGWIQDTLCNFLTEKNQKVIFVHIDIDTYETTKFILKNIKPFLKSGSIIIFDEMYNYPGWENNEYKALTEEFDEDFFEFIAFSDFGQEAIIKIK